MLTNLCASVDGRRVGHTPGAVPLGRAQHMCIHTHTHIYVYKETGLRGSVFINGLHVPRAESVNEVVGGGRKGDIERDTQREKERQYPGRILLTR